MPGARLIYGVWCGAGAELVALGLHGSITVAFGALILGIFAGRALAAVEWYGR